MNITPWVCEDLNNFSNLFQDEGKKGKAKSKGKGKAKGKGNDGRKGQPKVNPPNFKHPFDQLPHPALLQVIQVCGCAILLELFLIEILF